MMVMLMRMIVEDDENEEEEDDNFGAGNLKWKREISVFYGSVNKGVAIISFKITVA